MVLVKKANDEEWRTVEQVAGRESLAKGMEGTIPAEDPRVD